MKDVINPCGLSGFAFLEFSTLDKEKLHYEFTHLGFHPIATHKHADITLYLQGHIRFILNNSDNSQARKHALIHNTGACAMGFKVKNADDAINHALKHGAKEFKNPLYDLRAIEGIGGSVIYFIDSNHHPFQAEWDELLYDVTLPESANLVDIDHLTHNVKRGNMDKWAKFYEDIFNFKEIRFFDIEGQQTGLLSRALASPCGNIKIPLNESKDDKSQIEEFLHDYHGEGIQHIALNTNDIYSSVATLRKHGIKFLDVPDTYYEMINDRLPWQGEKIDKLKDLKILIDGEKNPKDGLLLQIFTENLFGPVFFEIIQRKGNEGFGEGNFKALFEAIERDQIRRGTL